MSVYSVVNSLSFQEQLANPVASHKNRYEMLFVASNKNRYEIIISLPFMHSGCENDFARRPRIDFLA